MNVWTCPEINFPVVYHIQTKALVLTNTDTRYEAKFQILCLLKCRCVQVHYLTNVDKQKFNKAAASKTLGDAFPY